MPLAKLLLRRVLPLSSPRDSHARPPHRPAARSERLRSRTASVAAGLLALVATACGGDPDAARVLVLVNAHHAVSRAIGEDYARRRELPNDRILALDLPAPDAVLGERGYELIGPDGFEAHIAAPLRAWLAEHDPDGDIDILVTTKGVPLAIDAANVPAREWIRSYEGRSVDAALSVLDGPLAGRPGLQDKANPFFDSPRTFGEHRRATSEPRLRFLVARLTSFQDRGAAGEPAPASVPADLRAMLESAQAETPPGAPAVRHLVDLDPSLPAAMSAGNLALLHPTAAALRAQGLVVDEDERPAFVGGAERLRGYVSWGSNDSSEPSPRTWGEHDGLVHPGTFAPRAIASTLVSTNARTFTAPAEYGQSLIADLLHAGAAAATGHVAEPTLGAVARPYVLLPRYAAGELAVEAYYKSLPYLGWTHVFVGDPLMRLPEAERAPLPRDRDGDGVEDGDDNCLHIPNADQRDSDGDRIGNVCDADVDGDGVVTTSFGRIFPVADRGDVEWIALTARSGPYDPDHDLDGDGVVDERDVAIAQIGLFRRPGPSGPAAKAERERAAADGS